MMSEKDPKEMTEDEVNDEIATCASVLGGFAEGLSTQRLIRPSSMAMAMIAVGTNALLGLGCTESQVRSLSEGYIKAASEGGEGGEEE